MLSIFYGEQFNLRACCGNKTLILLLCDVSCFCVGVVTRCDDRLVAGAPDDVSFSLWDICNFKIFATSRFATLELPSVRSFFRE